MAGILRLISDNLGRGPVTVRLPDTVPVPAEYRGGVAFAEEQCLACGICAYVCVSAAIAVSEHAGRFEWRYDPGCCAFCGRCVDYCPANALSMAPKVTHARTAAFALPQCRTCGQPVRPSAGECERCRRRRFQHALKASYEG